VNNAHTSKRLINYSFMQQLGDIAPFLVVSLAIGFPTLLISYLPIPCIVQLLLQFALYALLTVCYYERRQCGEYVELKNMVMGLVANIRHKVGK